jgi:ABC-2 type transport system permease protein
MMRNIRYLLGREFSSFWSNKIFVFAFLALPVLLTVVLGFVYREGKVTHLPVIIVDKDQTPLSIRLRDILEDNSTLKVVNTKYESVNLQDALLKERAVAVIVIPYRFEADVLNGRRPEVNCYLNVANTLTSSAAGNAISLCAATLNAGIATATLQRKAVPASLALQQYQTFRNNIFYKYNPSGNYLYFLWPGLIFSILHQVILMVMAVSFSREFADNHFNAQGLLSYNHSAFVLILVKTLPYLIMSFITVLCYYLLSIYFRVPVATKPEVLFLSQFLLILSTCFLGTFYSIVYPFPLKATQLLISIASPAFTISGFTWPAHQAPEFFQVFGQIIPLTPYLRTLRMVLLQQANISDVWPMMQHQLILLVTFFCLSMLLLKLKIRKALQINTG